MNIVFASHTEIGGTFVVGSHHLAREMARRGHRVFHLSAAVTPAHLARLRHAGVRRRFALWHRGGERTAEGVVNYVGLSALPWQAALQVATPRWNPYLSTLPSLLHVLRRHEMHSVDALLVDQPQFAGIETLLRPRVLVYRATDLYHEMTGSNAIAAAERRLTRAADLLVGTAEPVLSRLRAVAPATPALLLENGVEFERFAQPAAAPDEYRDIPAPRILYTGALDERFEPRAVEAIARAHPQVHIVLIGPGDGPRMRSLAAYANVHCLGPRPYAELPRYLQHAAIAILPLARHPANEGRSPMKLFEYGAAGLPVVASATRELSRRGLPFVQLVERTDDFATAIGALLADATALASYAARARASARRYGWPALTQTLLDALDRCGAAASLGPSTR